MKPNTTGSQQSRSTYGPGNQGTGSSSNPHTGHPIRKYLVPANTNLPHVQQIVRDPSNGHPPPPTLPQSGTRLTASQILGDARSQPLSSGWNPYGHPRAERPHQAVPQTAPHPGYAYETPQDPVSDSENSESNDLGPFEQLYRAPDQNLPSLEHTSNPGFFQRDQFAGSALPARLVYLHESTMRTSEYPSLPAGYRNLPYYRHHVIGLPQEPFQQAPVQTVPYDPRGGSLNPGASFPGLPEPQVPQGQSHIATTQGNTDFKNAPDNLKKRIREEFDNPRPTLFNAIAKAGSMDRMTRIVESSGNHDEAQNLIEIALRHWERQQSRSSVMLCMFSLLTPCTPDEQLVRELELKFEVEPPLRPLPPELERLWGRCLERRDEINAKVVDPTLRDRMFKLINSHFFDY